MKNHYRNFFSRLSLAVSVQAKTIVVMSIFAIVLLGLGTTKLKMKVDPESTLRASAESRSIYNQYRKDFGSDQNILLIIEADDVLSLDVLHKIRDLHESIDANLPHVDKVESLINARIVRGDEDDLIIEELTEAWPRNEEELVGALPYYKRNAIYRNLLVSDDQRYTTITIKPLVPIDPDSRHALNMLSNADGAELITELYAVTDKYQSDDFKIAVAGGPTLAFHIIKGMQTDMGVFNGISVLIIVVVLYFSFRRLSGVLLPLLVIVATTVSIFGLMGWIGKPITPLSQILPSLVLVIGLGDSVHFLTLFFRRYTVENVAAGITKADCVEAALVHCGPAMFLTTLTTVGGLVSFYISDIVPVSEFGIYAPIGVMMAFIFSVTLLPALVHLSSLEPVVQETKRRKVSDRLLVGLSDIGYRHPKLILSAWLVLGLVFGILAYQIPFSYSTSKLLGDDHIARKDVIHANENLGWGTYLDIIVDTKEKNGIYNPEMLRLVEEIQRYVMVLEVNKIRAANSSSIVDLIKEINRGLNADEQSHFRIPDSKEMIAQEFLLFEMSGADDLSMLVDQHRQKTRISLLMPEKDMIEFRDYVLKLEDEIDSIVDSSTVAGKVSVQLTGIKTIEMDTFHSLMTTVSASYLIAFAVITPLMVLVVRQFGLGLLMMLPNMLPIICALGVMQLFGIPLNQFTIMIGSIAMGIAVDDTIHFMAAYQHFREEGVEQRRAIHQTVQTSGAAMLTTSLTLVVGFSTYGLASMEAVSQFGLVTALCIGLAFVSDILLAPALVTLFDRAKRQDAGAVEQIERQDIGMKIAV